MLSAAGNKKDTDSHFYSSGSKVWGYSFGNQQADLKGRSDMGGLWGEGESCANKLLIKSKKRN